MRPRLFCNAQASLEYQTCTSQPLFSDRSPLVVNCIHHSWSSGELNCISLGHSSLTFPPVCVLFSTLSSGSTASQFLSLSVSNAVDAKYDCGDDEYDNDDGPDWTELSSDRGRRRSSHQLRWPPSIAIRHEGIVTRVRARLADTRVYEEANARTFDHYTRTCNYNRLQSNAKNLPMLDNSN